MARALRILLCAAFALSFAVAGIGCGSGSGGGAKPTHSDEQIEKAKQLGKDIGINYYDQQKKKQN
jgi:hypothetical protein